MNISMIPNNDVKTIHASQGDTQRVWNFVPYGENGVINTSQDEYASFDSIKGNTLVWNQLVQNGNFADTSGWTAVSSATINSVSNNTINVTTSATAQSGISNPNINMVQGHKYLLVGTIKTTGQTYISISGVGTVLFNTNSFVTKSNIFTWASASGSWSCMIRNWDVNSATFEAKNIMLIDLTQLGLDVTAQEFVSYFPLSYYPYDSGSLLSFNGSGIKTTGKNLLDPSILANNLNIDTTTYLPVAFNGRVSTSSPIDVSLFDTVAVSFGERAPLRFIYSLLKYDGTKISRVVGLANGSTINTSNGDLLYLTFYESSAITMADIENIQVEKNSATSYEPYTESITTLPTLTYFPTGMKSAGSVYDELTPSKAITRIGSVNLGTLDWIAQTTAGGEYRMASLNGISALAKHPASSSVKANLLCADYPTITADNVYLRNKGVSLTSSGGISIYDSSYNTQTSTEAFKTAMSGVYLYFELASESSVDIDEDLTYPVEVGGTEEILPSALLNGAVDLGTLTYTMYSVTQGNLFRADLSDAVLPYDSTNILCAKYPTLKASERTDKCVCVGSVGRIDIIDSSYSDATAFASAMSGVYLWYEKTDSEPTTTPIKADIRYPDGVQSGEFTYKQTEFESMAITGSMVCKGLEIEGETDENGITIQSTSELTSEPGFFDCKLKLTQGDGVCYSSKFQLHVEKRPS